MNQKAMLAGRQGFVNIILVGIVVLIIGAVGFFVLMRKLAAPPETSTTPAASNLNTQSGLLVLSNGSAAGGNDPGNIYVIKPDGTGKKLLTNDGKINILPAWSYNGSKIVYTSKSAGVTSETGQIWTMNANGTNKKQLTSGSAGGITAAFSPDGTHIVYSGLKTGHPETWVMNFDGTNQKQLTTTTKSSKTRNGNSITWSIHPTYSPDGKKIVYASTQDGHSEIWVMNADGSNQTQLTFIGNPTAPDANAPAWSPDGKKIAFWSGYETEYGNLWVINSDGTGRTQLTHETKVNVNSDNPNWSPDGESIVFESNRQPNPNINGAQTWIMNADGSNPRVFLPYAYGAGRRPWKGK